MSYLSEVKIIPSDSYKVIRNCPKCGCKTHYINTNCFRVNANGNNLDVWLIYQCEKCKHTYNLTIYERVRPDSIPKESYRKFLANDKALALTYGNQKALFIKNKAEIDLERLNYEIVAEEKKPNTLLNQQPAEEEKVMIIHNPQAIRVRVDKVLSEVLNISRSKVKVFLKDEKIYATSNYVGEMARIIFKQDLFQKAVE